MKVSGFWRLIRSNRQARYLWYSETIAAFGTYFFDIALMWYVFVRTGSGLATGLVAVAAFAPVVTLGVLFGSLADRYCRKRIMVLANLVSAGLAGIMATSVFFHLLAVWPIYLITALMGTASTLYNPARSGLFSQIISHQDLLTAHALFHSSQQIARLVGSAVGGVIVALVGPAPTMSLDVVTFMIAAALVGSIKLAYKPVVNQVGEPFENSEITSAWQWIRRRPVLLVMSAIGMVSNIALGPSNVLPPMLIRQSFHANAAALGLFDAAIGLGIIVGGIVIGMLIITRVGISLTVALSLEALGLLMVALSPYPGYADIGNLILGIGLVTANVPSATMVQTLVPSELMGRVSAFFGMMSAIAIPVTYGGVGLVGDAIGPHSTYGLAAALMGAVSLTALLVPGIRQFRLERDRVSETDSTPRFASKTID